MQPTGILKNRKLLLLLVLLSSMALLAVARRNHWFEKQPQPVEYDGKEELKHLYNNYMQAAAGFDIGGKITLYDMEQKNAVKEQSVFRNVKQGNNYYSSMMGQRTFFYNGVWIQVDSMQKSIIVAAVQAQDEATAASAGFPLEKYLGDTAALRLSVTAAGNDVERVLRLQNELTPEIKSVAIYYRPADYTITRMEIQWWKNPPSLQTQKEDACWLSVIQMEPVAKLPFAIDKEIARVVQPVQNEWRTTDEYRNYELTVTPGTAVSYP